MSTIGESFNMLEIVLASSNPGKIREFEAIFANLAIKLIPQSDLNISDADETGTTFVENAIIKARHAAEISGLPAIADDSGLVIDALDGMPGVRSSRFAGPNGDDAARIKKVLDKLKNAKMSERDASFHCVTVLMEDALDPAPLICEGVWDGQIIYEPKGDKGFGYDPIFYVPTHKCSAAELDPAIKNRISHRGQALEQLAAALQEISM